LKRLALLFDEIHFTRPTFAAISSTAAESIEKGQTPVTINGIRDIESWEVLSLEGETEEVLDALTGAGVAFDRSDLVSDRPTNDVYLAWRYPMLTEAIRDAGWNAVTDTSREEYSDPTITKLLIKTDSGEERSVFAMNQPKAVALAGTLAAVGFLSDSVDGVPVFDDEARHWLSYKYRRYREQMADQEEMSFPLFSHEASFGQAAFAIGNAVFSSQSLERRSVEEILRFRAEMELARRQLLSKDLMDLASLIEENPWSPRSADELKKFVNGKLASDIATFDAGSISTWEKLYGALAVRAVSIGQAAGLGGTAGAVTGHVLPQTSFWGMLLTGLVLGASKEAPNVTRDLVEAVREDRERQRSGIAFVARFPD